MAAIYLLWWLYVLALSIWANLCLVQIVCIIIFFPLGLPQGHVSYDGLWVVLSCFPIVNWACDLLGISTTLARSQGQTVYLPQFPLSPLIGPVCFLQA